MLLCVWSLLCEGLLLRKACVKQAKLHDCRQDLHSLAHGAAMDMLGSAWHHIVQG